jgi:hypothetical protein
VDLGLSDVEFGDLTLGRFNLIYAQHCRKETERVQREDYRFGVLAALVSNFGIDTEKTKPRTPADFFPSLAEVMEERTRRQSPKQILATFQRLAAMQGRNDKP